MLLSEEELRDNQFYLDKFTEPAILKGSKRVAKAQLKKVVEGLKPHIHIRKDAPYKSTIDPDIWQALLEEIE